MAKATDQYYRENYRLRTNTYHIKDDPGVQVYPTKGQDRTEYLALIIKDKDPQTSAEKGGNLN